MNRFFIIIFAACLAIATPVLPAAPVALAADCQTALFQPDYGIFAHEGGYQNSKEDGGNWSSGKVGVGRMCGGTKFGLACAYNPKLDIRNLSKEQAAAVYGKNQCAEIRISEFLGQRDPTMLLDLGVNMGTGTAIKMFKKARNASTYQEEPPVPITTTLTDDDIAWYNRFTADRHHRRLFLYALALAGMDRYTDIVEANPRQARWLLGWIMRINPLND